MMESNTDIIEHLQNYNPEPLIPLPHIPPPTSITPLPKLSYGDIARNWTQINPGSSTSELRKLFSIDALANANNYIDSIQLECLVQPSYEETQVDVFPLFLRNQLYSDRKLLSKFSNPTHEENNKKENGDTSSRISIAALISNKSDQRQQNENNENNKKNPEDIVNLKSLHSIRVDENALNARKHLASKKILPKKRVFVNVNDYIVQTDNMDEEKFNQLIDIDNDQFLYFDKYLFTSSDDITTTSNPPKVKKIKENQSPVQSPILSNAEETDDEEYTEGSNLTPQATISWTQIIRNDIYRHYRQFTNTKTQLVSLAKRTSVNCMKEVKKKVLKSVRSGKDASNRGKKLSREVMMFWRKHDKEQRGAARRAQKEASEQRKRDEEIREAKRQQKKLNFLLTQTELYAHFIGKKVGIDTEEVVNPNEDEDSNITPQPPDKMEISKEPEAPTPPIVNLSLSMLNVQMLQRTQAHNAEQLEDAKMQQKAAKATEKAIQATHDRAKAFDLETERQKLKLGLAPGLNKFSIADLRMPTLEEKKAAQLPAMVTNSTPLSIPTKSASVFATTATDPTPSVFLSTPSVTAPKPIEAPAEKEEPPKEQVNNLQNSISQLLQPPSDSPNDDKISQPTIFAGALKKYQLRGLNWLVNLYDQGINGILADEMGLGKTIQTIAFLAHLAEEKDIWGPFLIIAPVSTLHNWLQEINRFTPAFKALPYWGTVSERKVIRRYWTPKNMYVRSASMHIIVTSYQLVVQDEKYFRKVKWQYMVMDEAHALKSAQSVRWKILLGFHCRNRLLLTGTPIQNNMGELWALLHFIMPTFFDSHDEFNDWFSKDIENHAEGSGVLNEQQLSRLHTILKPFMLRRVKQEVENEMVKKTELEIRCKLTERQKKLYQAIKSKISLSDLLHTNPSSKLDHNNVQHLMNLVMQFRKVCNHPELFERRPVSSPFQFINFHLGQITNPIHFYLPKLFAFDFEFLNYSRFDDKNNLILKYFYLFTNSYVHDSLFPSSPSASSSFLHFLHFLPYSPAEFVDLVNLSMLYRFEHWNNQKNHLKKLLFYSNFNEREIPIKKVRDSLHFTMQFSENFQQIKKLKEIKIRKEEKLLRAVKTCYFYKPPAWSTPVNFVSSDRGFAHKKLNFEDNGNVKKLLLGNSYLPRYSNPPNPTDAQFRKINQLKEYKAETGGYLNKIFRLVGSSKIKIPDFHSVINDSGKLRALDELLIDLKKNNHRVLIYSQMTKMLNLLEEFMSFRKYSYHRLDGASKLASRRDMVSDFQQNDEVFIFLLSTRAGGLGINLTAADTVIFYDSDWNPTMDAQAMDRAHRLGQTRPVTVYRLVTENTIEERILTRAKEKHNIQSIVIAGGKFEAGAFSSTQEVVSLLLDDNEVDDSIMKNIQDHGKKKNPLKKMVTKSKPRKKSTK